jgi:FG-GAP repeat
MKKIFIAGAFILFAVIVYAQNVGIGVPTPTEKLHVAGNIKSDTVKTNVVKITPNAGTGKILTSDAAGNANWQTNNAASAGNVGFGVWGDCATNGNISEYNPVVDATGSTNDNFGFSLSISGNYAIVGSVADDVGANADQGSASIYQFTGGSWVLMQKITDATGASGDRFGGSVSISGNYAIVGAPFDDGVFGTDQGSASIYQWNGSNWVLMNKITDATGSASDLFGYSVSVSGNYAIMGAYNDDGVAGVDQGSASIYNLSSGSWVLVQKITDATGAASDLFGISVSISGNYAIVGAEGDDDLAGSEQGSVSIYNLSSSSWVLVQKITDATGATGDRFGAAVSISGNYAIVGANRDDGVAGADQGSASIYIRVGLGWQRLQYVTDPGGATNNFFGYAIAIDTTTQRFLCSSYFYASGSGKVVFGKVN